MRRNKIMANDAVDVEVVPMAAGSEGDESHTVIPLPGPLAKEEEAPKKILSFPATNIQKTIFEFSKRTMRDDYQRIYFVSRAASNDVTRSYHNIIHVEPSEQYGCRIFATDGKRIHIAELECELPPGNYHFRANSTEAVLKGPIDKDDDAKFPNYRRIIFKHQKFLYNLDFDKTGLGKDLKKTFNMTRKVGYLIHRSNILINLRFLDDLIKLRWSIYTDADEISKAVIFKASGQKELLAVLMPLVDWDEDDDYDAIEPRDLKDARLKASEDETEEEDEDDDEDKGDDENEEDEKDDDD
jgi:hypothetical protein